MEAYFFGALSEYSLLYIVPVIVLLFLILGYTGAHIVFWSAVIFATMWGYAAPVWLWVVFGVYFVAFNITFTRRYIVSGPIMSTLKALGFLPTISDTERIALNAGTTWIESEFFTGKPNFKKILNEAYPDLNEKELAFLNGPTEELCKMINDWEVYQNHDLPKEAWDYIKKEGFFGMIIPEKYGGHGFSATGTNVIISKLGTRSIPLCIGVMVPNSLGPAELLVHYGTKEQQDYYLPRLARGEDIPCFALTEPEAGSDAASISSSGVVFKGEDGELYLRLNWEKRYITLASISTLLGLAFQLKDPDNLLGKGEFPGITCALIPTDTKGVVLGRRHNPLGVPFINAPTDGHDVVVSVDQIIGGKEQAGNGWKMLMETLAGGRGVFLPAQSAGGTRAAALITGAYAVVRQQFGLSIGKFEGIEELLTRIGGMAYISEALSRFTCGAVDSGGKPAVVSAIAKYHSTELNRKVINDAMDLVGGAGISLGPRNLLGHGYIGTPIGITVEGSNIVTRSLIIFGQGLIRCHPYAIKEMEAIENNDLAAFDLAFWGHVGLTITNKFRSVLLSITRGRLAGSPVSGPTAKYYRKLSWASASFALLSDMALIMLGGSLKLKETLSGRFADILSWLYLASSVLRKYEAGGRNQDELPFVSWSVEYALYQIQEAFNDIFNNFPVPVVGAILRGPVAAWSRFNPIGKKPADRLGRKIAKALQTPGGIRDKFADGVFIPEGENEQADIIEKTFLLAHQSDPVYVKMKKAIRAKQLKKQPTLELAKSALKNNVITQEEYDLVLKTEKLRAEAIKVDAFDANDFPNKVVDHSRPVTAQKTEEVS